MSEEEKKRRIREIHAKQFLNFPTNTGISGSVFKSGEIHYSNNVIKETKYVEEIDNQSTSTDVRNFMIGPVFGQDKSKGPCAIIQFINKVDAEGRADSVQIEEADVNKFKEMQQVLGMCVEGTNEMSNTVNVAFDVSDSMEKIQNLMMQNEQREKTAETDKTIQELLESLQVIKTNYHRLAEGRKAIV